MIFGQFDAVWTSVQKELTTFIVIVEYLFLWHIILVLLHFHTTTFHEVCQI